MHLLCFVLRLLFFLLIVWLLHGFRHALYFSSPLHIFINYGVGVFVHHSFPPLLDVFARLFPFFRLEFWLCLRVCVFLASCVHVY